MDSGASHRQESARLEPSSRPPTPCRKATDVERVAVRLSVEERSLLSQAVLQCAGPARLTVGFVPALGFRDRAHLQEGVLRLHDALRDEDALTRAEWTQALLLTEIVWVSDMIGAASDWDAVTDFTDEDALRLLRSLQTTLGDVVDPNLLPPPEPIA